ncbi:MAG: type II toxin-antitoxin system RelE/ParE family toxin [Methylococcaceae bacterium]|nr:type II toxin-antitoxin system RelE/ParE family toxin [Methylococcaceae bacterium]
MKTWSIKFTTKAAKALKGFDSRARRRLENFINQLVQTENPRSSGKALQGNRYKGLWRYRVGDYRLIAQIKDNELIILMLEIDHRKDIYR